MLQVSLPLVLFGSSPSVLHLKGGTNAEMAPQVDFMSEIFRPNLNKFGASFDFTLEHRGYSCLFNFSSMNQFFLKENVLLFNRYFPKGGGYCIINVPPLKFLHPIQLTDGGNVTQFFGWSFVAGSLPVQVSIIASKSRRSLCLKNQW